MVAIVYLVAGMSSRYGGNVKQMAKIGPNNETLIQYSVDQALINPFSKIIFITNHVTEHLYKNIFGDKYKEIPVLYIEQKYDNNIRTRPWGTTDALCCIHGYINEPFILVNGDDIYGENTFKKGFSLLNNGNIIGCIKMSKSLPENQQVNRGVIFVNETHVTGIKEMLKISRDNNPELLDEFANVNFIGLQPIVLDYLNNILTEFKENNKNHPDIECLLPDCINILIKENKLKLEYFEIENEILGVTYPGDEIIVKNLLKNNK